MTDPHHKYIKTCRIVDVERRQEMALLISRNSNQWR